MNNSYVIACDLGTGGCKSSIYDSEGKCLNGIFKEYPTYYPRDGWHEQKPEEWWAAVKASILELLDSQADSVRGHVKGIGISGHSLGMVPVDGSGNLLMKEVPIWSDSRPGTAETGPFFESVSEDDWYMITGNGFPAALYTVFKILWMKNNLPDVFAKTASILGTKDYINYLLTGKMATDYSYASGTGIYDLKNWDYSPRLLQASGLDGGLFPEITDSATVLGGLTGAAAKALSLPEDVKVVAGGVDNSCMALGAGCYKSGRMYNSLGSSSWIAVSSQQPVLDPEKRPYVFAHVVPEQFASATAIFSAGSSHKWLLNILSGDTSPDYDAMNREAAEVPPGSENLLFNPSLAGGSSLDESPNIRGAFTGLSLMHGRAHLVRAVMEGIALGLRVALDVLRDLTETESRMTLVGGGSKSELWRQIIADIYGVEVVKSVIDQQAAALGAAALALVGCGIWKDYSAVDKLHEVEAVAEPDELRANFYSKLLVYYKEVSTFLARLGDKMQNLDKQP
ncbi:MAG: FGGY-family carbohydrate kinase [Spirochaetales bacterium]|uniref:FGGY-family carbohydrate kinase n=1 Tax=Candidatus Thalassospirochaeta sargassi TaxID=3119039 RepID=A0AAJ1IIH5_9SPIO|nr:FGGY-family carbohydrate kinase [Spirochaetales bacterium]